MKLTSLKAKNSAQAIVADLANKYNKLQDITDRTLDSKTVKAEYDEERRVTLLTTDPPEVHTYDKADNRVTTSAVAGAWVYDASNRLLQKGSTTYDYDAVGNLIKKADSVTNAVTFYRYDALNRLTQVEDANQRGQGDLF